MTSYRFNVDNIMNMINQKFFKVVTMLLLFQFSGDCLVLFDFFEPSGFGANFIETMNQRQEDSHFHAETNTEHQPLQPDFCHLCPCCTSQLGMYVSSFSFLTEQCFWGFLASTSIQRADFSDKHIFHPPQLTY